MYRILLVLLVAASGFASRVVQRFDDSAARRAALTPLLASYRSFQSVVPSPHRTGSPLPQPLLLASQNGTLEVHLTFVLANVSTPGGMIPVRAWTLTEKPGSPLVPAPTLLLRPGDTLLLHVRNALPSDASPLCVQDDCENTFHAPDSVNIHTHGLWISPSEDDVMVSLEPGKERTWAYHISPRHGSGLAWWHTHRHGSSGVHVGGGAAGALIVQSEADAEAVARLYAGRDLVVVLQTWQFDGWLSYTALVNASRGAEYRALLQALAGGPCRRRFNVSGGFDPSSFEFQLDARCVALTLNGALRPTIEVESGRWTRLRFVAAMASQSVFLATQGGQCEARQLAADGISFLGAHRAGADGRGPHSFSRAARRRGDPMLRRRTACCDAEGGGGGQRDGRLVRSMVPL